LNARIHSRKSSSPQAWLDAWYGSRRWTFFLLPLMWLFIVISALRRWWLCVFRQVNLTTPVIVVGNISVGGTGKTPLLISLVKYLQRQGFTPGVISRGYGGNAGQYPYLLDAQATAASAGDEPLSIYQRTGCAVCVGPDRVACATLLQESGCDLLLSDDGLQHYRLGRDIEIAVIDGQRALGNGFRLPVGPLRESARRLKTIDWVVVNTPRDHFALPQLPELLFVPMRIKPQSFVHLQSGALLPADHFKGQTLHAVAGIGNPARFYKSLQTLGITAVGRDFPDHHPYQKSDFDFAADEVVVMTEKDAVKCRAFAGENWYYLPVDAQLPDEFLVALMVKIRSLQSQKKSLPLIREK
jgi:tetraacyldisaccharide 4'-kinase